MKGKKETRADLERKVRELQGQLASSYHYAASAVARAGNDAMMGSGVVLELRALGGREIVSAVVIRDGLSPETIAAIQRDLERSYALATMLKPAQKKDA